MALRGPEAACSVGGGSVLSFYFPPRPYLPKQTAQASHPVHPRPQDRKQAVTAPCLRLPFGPRLSQASNAEPRRSDWLRLGPAARCSSNRGPGRPPPGSPRRREAVGSEVLHACGICSEGHDHFGQVFKCESAFGRSLGKIPRCCQAGFAACSFFFFKQFKRDNPTEWGKSIRNLSLAPQRRGRGLCLGARHLNSGAGAPRW